MAASAWQLVCGLDAWRVTQIPRRPARLPPAGTDDDGDLLAAQRAAALSAAYHGGAGPVGFAWVRDRPGGPVQVLAAGPGMAVAGGGWDTVLKIPAGGRGEPVGAGGLARALGALPCWVRIAGVADSLLADGDLRPGPGQGANGIRPSLEDGLLAVWTEPFAWLVLAEPASRPELQELAFTVYAAQGSAQRFDSPQAQLRARRLEGRHAELRQAASAGLWRVYVLAGAAGGVEAAEVAGLLCASADLGGLPYGLVPVPGCGRLDAVLDSPTARAEPPAIRAGPPGSLQPWSVPPPAARQRADEDGDPEPASPFYGSSAVLAALARPPAREIPGSARFVLRPEFDTIPEFTDKAFLIGAVLIRLAEYLRLRQRHQPGGPPALRHLTVLEEAHRLLRDPGPGQRGPAAKAVELFASLFAEVRAYGEGLVVAEQIPSKLITDVVKNTAVKIVHRLPAADDRQAVGATMNLTPAQEQYIVTLAPGEAAVFADGADFPWLVRMPDGTGREAAPAATAGPASIITPRSASCGPFCLESPCMLRQMRQAQRAAAEDPRITVWAELAVLAHLTGWAMPLPDDPFASDLQAMDERRRDCALAHAVDEALAARAAVISARVSPGPLAAHVAAAMRWALPDGSWLCEEEEPQFLAPPYRWVLVLEALQVACRDGPDGRHPRSAEWERTYDRPIPGQDCATQLETVTRWHHDDQRDAGRLHAAAWGQRPEAALASAIGAKAGEADWDERVASQLSHFTAPCRWPLDHLMMPGPGYG